MKTSIDAAASVVAGDMSSIDYTENFDTLTGAVNSLGSMDRNIIIPVYLGDEKVDTVVVNALNRAAYLTGG